MKEFKSLGRVLTVIPAKAASSRLKRKNVAMLGGQPLLAYPVKLAALVGFCGEIMVSTEDEAIAEIACSLGASVPFMRPAHLARDPYEVHDVCLDVLQRYEALGKHFDTMVILLPTCPFTSASDLTSAAKLFIEHDGKFLMSVSRMDPHYYHALQYDEQTYTMKRVFEGEDLFNKPPVRCNGGVHILDVEAFVKARTYYGEPLLGYEMPWFRSVDVDTEADLSFAEWLLNNKLTMLQDE